MDIASWSECSGWKACAAWLIIQPVTIVVCIPIIVIIFGGMAKWILAGGKPTRDHFLVGIELALTGLAMSFASAFDWFRGASTTGTTSPPDLLPVIFASAMGFGSVAVLLVVIALMRAYFSPRTASTPSITWPWFWSINLVGALPLGFAAALLVG